MNVIADIEIRRDYQTFSIAEWSYEECAEWLWNEGIWVCGDDGAFASATLDEIREEVAIQSYLIELDSDYRFDLIRDEFYRQTVEKHA